MKTKKIITNLIVIVTLLGNINMAYAADKYIPDYYSNFIGTWAYKEYGFEFHSLAFKLKAGEVYAMPSRLPDGTSVKFYYVCDGNSNMRLATPSGEIITRSEYEAYFSPKPNEPSVTVSNTEAANNDVTTPTPVIKASNTVSEDICEKDLAIWLDEDYELYENELEVIRRVNEERAKAGLNPVTLNIDLSKVARIKAIEMVELNYFSHESPNYGAHTDMVKKFGIDCKWAGENAARLCGTTAGGAMGGWMRSEGHRNHILNPKHKEIGVGFSEKDGIGYWSLFIMY